MSDESDGNDANQMEYGMETELSERELLSIGKIVALWGSLEYEIFCQTLGCFSKSEISEGCLPKTMNNMQFCEVLALWETRVVNKAEGKRRRSYRNSAKPYVITSSTEMLLCTECGSGPFLGPSE